MLRDADPDEAERLLALAQEAVNQRWATYEEMATRGPSRFAADARRDGHAMAPRGIRGHVVSVPAAPGGEQ
jgi:hypothetical protein